MNKIIVPNVKRGAFRYVCYWEMWLRDNRTVEIPSLVTDCICNALNVDTAGTENEISNRAKLGRASVDQGSKWSFIEAQRSFSSLFKVDYNSWSVFLSLYLCISEGYRMCESSLNNMLLFNIKFYETQYCFMDPWWNPKKYRKEIW